MYKEGDWIEQRDTLNYESHNSSIRQNLSHEESCNWKQTSNWDKEVFCSLFHSSSFHSFCLWKGIAHRDKDPGTRRQHSWKLLKWVSAFEMGFVWPIMSERNLMNCSILRYKYWLGLAIYWLTKGKIVEVVNIQAMEKVGEEVKTGIYDVLSMHEGKNNFLAPYLTTPPKASGWKIVI